MTVIPNLKSHIPVKVKEQVKGTLEFLRGQLGALPNFFIIGAQRCGTTSLYNYLTQHLSIVAPSRKELHYFSYRYDRGINWYRSQFVTRVEKFLLEVSRDRRFITGEASPSYLYHPHAAKRLRKQFPEVQLIVLLRNPVDRAYSNYKYNIKVGYEERSTPFETALCREHEEIAREHQRILKEPSYYSFDHQMFSYVSRGIYFEQLSRWLNYFPREQFLIIKSEELYADPAVIVSKAFQFLGVPDFKPKAYGKYNSTETKRMPTSTRERLEAFFQPYNQKLYELVGVDFGW